MDDPRVKVAQLFRVRVDDEEHELDAQDDGRAQQVVQVYECVRRHLARARRMQQRYRHAPCGRGRQCRRAFPDGERASESVQRGGVHAPLQAHEQVHERVQQAAADGEARAGPCDVRGAHVGLPCWAVRPRASVCLRDERHERIEEAHAHAERGFREPQVQEARDVEVLWAHVAHVHRGGTEGRHARGVRVAGPGTAHHDVEQQHACGAGKHACVRADQGMVRRRPLQRHVRVPGGGRGHPRQPGWIDDEARGSEGRGL